ncbi:hypothetical protein EE612_053434, partial [Oryza sativa]
QQRKAEIHHLFLREAATLRLKKLLHHVLLLLLPSSSPMEPPFSAFSSILFFITSRSAPATFFLALRAWP